MSRMRKPLVWFMMLTKRLLSKWSFVALLLIIPLVIPVVTASMKQESGMLKIALCNEEENPEAKKIVESLTKKESVILFSEFNTRKEAEKAVKQHNVDAAWIFSEEYKERVQRLASGKRAEPPVEIIEREENVPLKISREVLFAAMYSDVSYHVYEDYIYSKLVDETILPKEKAKEYYFSQVRGSDILEIEKLGNAVKKPENINYLTAPIRGLLSLMIVLCALSAATYFLKDQQDGRFDWLPYRKRLIPAFGMCFSAVVLSSIIVVITLFICQIFIGTERELASIVMFAISVTGFALLFCILFKSYGKLSAIIPGILIVAFVMSPIFFNLKILRAIRLMLPTYYYLKSIYDNSYYFYGMVYLILIYGMVFVLNLIMSRCRADKKGM